MHDSENNVTAVERNVPFFRVGYFSKKGINFSIFPVSHGGSYDLKRP